MCFLLVVAMCFLVYNVEIVHDIFLLIAAPENLFLKYEAVNYGLINVHWVKNSNSREKRS